MKIRIGIIGGSGLNNSEFFKNATVAETITSGQPSSPVLLGQISDVDCALLVRHGKGHTIQPSDVDYRANIEALKYVGCTHIIATAACGSLREEYKPGDFVIIDQFIDRTYKRQQTFYDGKSDAYKGILHLPMGTAFCTRTGDILNNSARSLCQPGTVHSNGTIVTVEGPRFSTKAESKMHQLMGGDLVGMTTVPEVVLSKELGICYASLAIVTDYDCWKENEVNVEMVLATFKRCAEKAIEVIQMTVTEIAKLDWTETITSLKKTVADSIMLPPANTPT